MNLVEVLLSRAEERGAQPAIVESRGGRDFETSFADLADGSARAAAALDARGIKPGSHVLFLAPMSARMYVWLIGVLRVGAVAMFLDPSAGRAHAARCLRMITPGAFVGSARAHLLRLVLPELRHVPAQFCLDGWIPFTDSCAPLTRYLPRMQLAKCANDQSALVTFTSGSTGEPKAVVRSHGFLLAQHRVLEKTLELTAGGRDLTTLPIFLLANLASGVTSIIPEADLRRPGMISPGPVLDQIRRLRPETCGAAPAFVERLCEGCEQAGRDLAPLRRLYVGGGPVFPTLMTRARHLLRDGSFVSVYGSTEAEPIAHVAAGEMTPSDYQEMVTGAGLLAGRPIPEIELVLLRSRWGAAIGPFTSESFRALRLPAGEVGEIVVSGQHVVRGYLHGRGDEETKFDVDGVRWHRTGDLGKLDGTERLWLLGRCAAAMDDGRGTLYPFAVECAAQQHPGVRRAALASVAGRRILAYEAGKSGPVETEIRATLSWANLDAVVTVAKIPLDARHNSKIDYAALAKSLRGR